MRTLGKDLRCGSRILLRNPGPILNAVIRLALGRPGSFLWESALNEHGLVRSQRGLACPALA